jgi:leader peptidase (prepilin peptidase)/N-methyltransferase
MDPTAPMSAPLVPDWFWGVIVFVFGACWGSFLNVCIWRMPRELSVVRPASHCGSCQKPIAWYDNLPLLSYFLLGGQCRHCGAKFSFRYWLVEFLNAAFWLLVWRKLQPGTDTMLWLMVVAYCILISMLLIGTFIDFEFYIIPDRITLGLVVVGLVYSVAVPALHDTVSRPRAALESVLGILAGGLSLLLIVELGKLAFGRLKLRLEPGTEVVIEQNKLKLPDDEIHWEEVFFRPSDRIRFEAAKLTVQDKTFENVPVRISETEIEVGEEKFEQAKAGKVVATTDLVVIPREAMGLGDVKLMAGIGAFVGWRPIFFILMASALLGSIVGLALVVLGKRELQGKIPYGPYIALAAIIWLFFGQDILGWYWGLAGGREP